MSISHLDIRLKKHFSSLKQLKTAQNRANLKTSSRKSQDTLQKKNKFFDFRQRIFNKNTSNLNLSSPLKIVLKANFCTGRDTNKTAQSVL